MALKNYKTNQYIKLDLEGNYLVYKSSKEREVEKSSINFKVVIAKYHSILKQLLQDFERLYYDPTFWKVIQAWENERDRYFRCHMQGLPGKNFPLISQYIKDPEGALPEILDMGQINVKGNTLQEVYEYVKHRGFFEDVEDC